MSQSQAPNDIFCQSKAAPLIDAEQLFSLLIHSSEAFPGTFPAAFLQLSAFVAQFVRARAFRKERTDVVKGCLRDVRQRFPRQEIGRAHV